MNEGVEEPQVPRAFKRSLCASRWIAACVAWCCLACGRANAADAQSFLDLAAWAPATTPLFVGATDLGTLEEDWKKTIFFEVYEEPSMQAFWDDLRTKKGGILPTERLGITWPALREAASGGAAYLSWPTQSDGLGVLMLALSENSSKAMDGREAVRQTWKQRGYEISERSIQGVDVIAAKLPLSQAASKQSATAAKPSSKDKGDKKDKPNPAAIEIQSWRFAFVYKDRLALCDRQSVATELLTRLKGKSGDSLAKLPVFMQMMKADELKTEKPGTLHWYVDPWQLWRASLDAKSKNDRAQLKRLNYFQRQGFEAVSALGGVARFGSGDNDVEHETQIILNGSLTKGARMLTFTVGSDFQTPTWLPGSLTEVTALHCDPAALVKGYGSIYDELYGENYEGAFRELIDSIETEADGPQAMVRRDLLERLQPMLFRLSDFGGKKSKTNPSGKRQMLVAGTNDSAKTAKAIERFFAGEDNVKLELKKEASIWQTKDPAKPLFKPASDSPMSFQVEALAVAHDCVLLGSDAKLLRETVESTASSQNQKSLPILFAGKPPENLCSRMHRELSPEMRSEFELARQNKLRESGTWQSEFIYWMLFAGPTNDSVNLINDTEKLPNFDEVKIAWGQESQDVETHSGGWRIRGHIKKRTQK